MIQQGPEIGLRLLVRMREHGLAPNQAIVMLHLYTKKKSWVRQKELREEYGLSVGLVSQLHTLLINRHLVVTQYRRVEEGNRMEVPFIRLSAKGREMMEKIFES